MMYTEKFTWAGKELTIKREKSPVDVLSAESAQIKLKSSTSMTQHCVPPIMRVPKAQSCRCFRLKASGSTFPNVPKSP